MVYIVTETSYNGYDDRGYDNVFAVYNNEAEAKTFCEEANKNRNSAYSSEYDYEKFNVK